MKNNALLTLALILSTPLTLFTPQERDAQEEEAEELSGNAVTRFFQEEGARLAEEVQGSWILFDYVDPQEPELAEAASGFATFHDGLMTFMLTVDAWETRIFRQRKQLIVFSGAFRYRFDEQAFLQMSSVMSFTNQTESRQIVKDPPGDLHEYYARIEDGLLELRNPEGVVLTFRQVTGGEFPDRDIRALESMRSGTEQWEELDTRR